MSPRRDVQGLRAFAVLAVIADHLFQWPRGGFIGVDVFFVLSGFLITGLLFREHGRTGKISFSSFYRRRARRILPISTLVLAVTVGASFLLYLSAHAKVVAEDAAWSFFFSANWHLAAAGTNYWNNGEAVSPLQHYWSLAVEEQFYLVWPWLLVVVLGLKFGRRTLFVVMVFVAVASFGWSAWETMNHPTWAYFNTFSRAWELALGAILAVAAPIIARATFRIRPLLAWSGLVLMIASLFLVTEDRFPAPWALVPVLGTALVIAAGTGGDQRFLFPLTNPLSNYIGDISYSLYLWHFPVVILLALVMPAGVGYDLTALLLMFGLSIASYHLLEDPIRHSSWLEPKTRIEPPLVPSFTRNQAGDWVPVQAVSAPRRRVTGLGRGFVALGLSAGLTVAAVTFLQPAPAVVAAAPADTSTQQPATAKAEQAVAAAVTAQRFPTFSPPIDSLDTEAWLKRVANQGCMGWDTEPTETSADTLKSCVSGDGTANKSVVLLGDSYAVAWMPAVAKAYAAKHWTVYVVSKQQCPTISVTVTLIGGGTYAECNAHRQRTFEMIKKAKPDLVVLADSEDTPERLASKATGRAADAEISAGLVKTLASVTPYAGRTVVLTPPPTGKAMQGCVTKVATPADCVSTVSPAWQHFADDLKSASAQGNAQLVDTHLWFCTADGRCPGFVGSTPMRVDDVHLTTTAAQSLAPVLVEAIH